MQGGKKTNQTVSRATVVGLIIAALFAALLLKILFIQTVQYDIYQSKVINQMTTEITVKAKRGNIYDRNGKILATDVTAYNLIISPRAIANAQARRAENDDVNQVQLIANGISEILGEEYYEKVIENSKHTTKLYRKIKGNIPDDSEGEGSIIDKLNIFISENKLYDQVYLEQTSIRYYPYGTLGCHIIGFCGADGNGLYGIERSYNDVLAGVDGKKVRAIDAHGNEMDYDYESYVAAVDGCDVWTTIDVDVQAALDEQCEQSLINTGSRNRTCGIVMEPDTGAILAMSTAPAFDLNNPSKLVEYYQKKLDAFVEENDLYADGEVDTSNEEYQKKLSEFRFEMWQNKAISDAFIPGSTFKIITSAMALDDKVVSDPYMTDGRFYCVPLDGTKLGGSRDAAGVLMHCHSLHNSQNFAEGLMNSCNVTFISLGLGIGKESFYTSFDKYGYLDKTGIDLPDEGRSIMHSYDNLGIVELATSAFGQNFKITGIQHITAVNAVVNGGTLYKPYTVSKAVDRSGNVIFSQNPTALRQVASEEACETLHEILEECVSGGYGGKNCYVPGYRVAAKTGTSEKVGDDKNGISGKDLRIGSVMAFAPAEAPVATAFFMCDEPDPEFGSTYGSTVAAPYMQALMEEILPYMNVDRVYDESEKDSLTYKVPNFEGWSISYLKKHFAEYYPDAEFPEIVGTGSYIASQQPAAGTLVVNNGKLKLYLYTSQSAENTNLAKVPNVVGSTAAASIQSLVNNGFNVMIDGKEYYDDVNFAKVISQSVAPGESLPKGSVIELYFGSSGTDDAGDWWTHEDETVYG